MVAVNRRALPNGSRRLHRISKGAAHAFRNLENTPVRMVVLLTPGGFEQVMPAMKGRPISEFAELAARLGLQDVGPQIDPAALSRPRSA